MKPFRLFVCVIFVTTCGFAAASSWQYGRIIQIQKSVNSRTKAWVVNTPITDETTVYTIWVHLENSVLTGTYELSSENSAPPPEWTTKYAVKVQVAGDTMYVLGPTAYVRLHITKRQTAADMLPLTKEETKTLADLDGPPRESMIGFSKESRTEAQSEKPAEPAAAPQPAPKPANTGTITVRSTPYLSEVFVDGESMGYTPAKINLAPGKHTFRVEKVGYKAWSIELTLAVGSELTLDATLEKR
jgi:PEGA domain-containing protein